MISDLLSFARSLISKAQPTMPLTNSDAFFADVRKITGGLDQEQVDVINSIVSQAAQAKWPTGYLAYGLATAWHEARFKPQNEWGKGKGRPYAAKGKYGQPQYGRGLVQLTWDRNYEWADKALALNGALLKNFDLANRADIASGILIKGMQDGAFTGKKLRDYITGGLGSIDGFTQARRIINGTDKAGLIANLALQFQNALAKGGYKGV